MTIFIFQFLSIVFAFGIVIFVHEFGHFIVARLNKIDVSVFSIGFGPRILSIRDKKGTEWQFAIIPLGGFVKFSDDDNLTSIKTRGVEIGRAHV